MFAVVTPPNTVSSRSSPASPQNPADFLLVWRAGRQTRPEGPRVTPPGCEAGDLGGPPPGPRTAQITRTDCFYYGYGSPPTVTVTVASSANGGVDVPS